MSDQEKQSVSAKEKKGFEKCFDMPFGGIAKGKHINKVPVTIALAVINLLMRLPFRFHVDDREKLAQLVDKTGVIVVSNHTSYLDVLYVYMSVRPVAWPRLIAKSSLLYDTPYPFGWILAHAGVFPIHRDSADRTAIKRAVRMLKNREVVGLMPEGTRRGKSDRAPQIYGGAALIARMAKVPILPMTVRNAENIKQKGKFLRFPKVSSQFGDPILIEDFDFLPKEDRLEGCMWYAMRECFALSQRKPADQVDMVALFPESKDFTEVFANHPIPVRKSEDLISAQKAPETSDDQGR